MTKTTIEIHAKGPVVNQLATDIYKALEPLRAEDSLDLRHYEYQSLGGVETLLITIAGTLVGNILSILFEKLVLDRKISPPPKHSIEVKHLDSQTSFHLPEQQRACLEFFGQSKILEGEVDNDDTA